jgi:hypothetical protein
MLNPQRPPKPELLALLRECHRRAEELRRADPPPAWRTLEAEEHRLQLEHGPRYSGPAWFGDVPEHERQRYLRAIAELERGGLLEVYRQWGRRVSHVRLTAEGERVLAELGREEQAGQQAGAGGGS